MGEAIIKMVHLMYQNNTAAHFLRGLNEKIKEEMERRHLTSAMHSDGDTARRDYEREVYKQCDEEDMAEMNRQ